jgi:hypothetical protein
MKTINNQTHHSYRYYFKDQKFLWSSDSSLGLNSIDEIKDVLYGSDSLNWELTVIAVSVGHPTHLKKRLVSHNGKHFWIEQNVVPIFDELRICGWEGKIVIS